METKNLADDYGAPLLEWGRVRGRLDEGFAQAPEAGGPGRHTCWVTTLNADGAPHANAVGALWDDGAFWFATGRGTRRGRNLARDPRCLLALSLRDLDLVVEGSAEPVTAPDDLTRVAGLWAAEGWPCQVDPDAAALTAPYSAQSAGPPPWHVYRLAPRTAHVVETVEPYGATRWRFSSRGPG